MGTRRDLLRTAAGAAAAIAFVGCDLMAPAKAQTNAAVKRQVSVNGRRIRTIDIHSHCAVREAMALMDLKLGASPFLPDGLRIDDEARIHAMDAQGIDIEVLSINPFWYKADPDLARQIVTLQNDKLAEFCAANPDRFVAFATVALQYPELAAEQLQHAVKDLGLRGALIGGSVNGDELSDAKFNPFWAKAEELGAVIFIHPQGVPEMAGRLKGNGILSNVIGNPLETTVALSHLIFEGTLDRYPGLKICAAHGGGYLPSYAARSDHGCLVFPNSCKPTRKKPTEYLKQLYYDALVFTPEALRHLVAEVGARRIMIGSDYPYPWTSEAVDHVFSTPGLNDDDRAAILGLTAADLLGIKV